MAEAGRGRGVVITSGTDTIEEVAVFCDALLGRTAPVVVTGAIRPASALGADGPANLLDAVAAAACARRASAPSSASRGEIHAARAVRKVDSTAPHAFSSPRGGAIGRVAEGRLDLIAMPVRADARWHRRLVDLSVPIVGTWLGDDGALLRAALSSVPDGAVITALGAGHLPPGALAALRDAPEDLPIVLTVRPERGARRCARPTASRAPSATCSPPGLSRAAHLAPPAARMLLIRRPGRRIVSASNFPDFCLSARKAGFERRRDRGKRTCGSTSPPLIIASRKEAPTPCRRIRDDLPHQRRDAIPLASRRGLNRRRILAAE